MLAISISRLRSNLTKFLTAVGRGEEIVILNRGQRVAKIVPDTDEQDDSLAKLEKLRTRCRVADVISPLNAKWKP